ncbi:MAG: DUF1499 domain-containing protein [Desulfoplanes sp.]|nr:DUF1499 domain-containing protein [Desulfoplanes sp.]MDD4648709.1 DUF1499 domain-containing protein [Desulfoplanes sp.]
MHREGAPDVESFSSPESGCAHMEFFVMKILLPIVLLVLFAGGCRSSSLPDVLEAPVGLDQCPQSPNCVFSGDRDAEHAILPWRIKGDLVTGWERICAEVVVLPRTTIVQKTPVYVHAECRSLIFRFVDDLECLLDPQSGVVAIRSSSRKGYSDFGVNRRRLETLRETLKTLDLID